jgi:hypothetical protein
MVNYKKLIISFGIAFGLLLTNKAVADVVVVNSDDTTVSLSAESRAAGTFDDNGNSFAVENVRLGTTGTHSVFSAGVSTQYDGSDLNLLDAYAGASLYGDYVNAKAGRFLIPADRNTMKDLYGLTSWQGTSVVSKWSSLNGFGRRDGVSISGRADIAGEVDVAYSAGVFDGANGEALVASRVELGVSRAKGLSIGGVIQSQDDAFASGQDFFGWGVDVLYANSDLLPGTVTVDAAFNDYDLDGATYVPGTGQNAGQGYTVGASFLSNFVVAVPVSFSPEPFFRFQRFEYDDGFSGEDTRFDAGVNLVLNDLEGTKLTVNYFNDEAASGAENDGVLLGLQVSF